MARRTKLIDIELSHPPKNIEGLDGYTTLKALVRLHGTPIGCVEIPVIGDCCTAATIRKTVLEQHVWPIIHHLLSDLLATSPHSEEWRILDLLQVSHPECSERLPMVTVVVCTRDRPEDLQRCLDGIVHLPDDGQEVLVVDNCPSTDTTHRLVHTYERIRYVREDKPGLDVARNRALREARGEIVAFVDDDAVPDPGWLRALARNFDDPLTICVTGLTMPMELETQAQEWFERYCGFGRGFQRTVFSRDNVNPLAAGRVGAGANMAMRRSVAELVGPFDEALDAGTCTRSGGDTEMFSRILSAGYRIVYDPAALNWHRHRRSWEELRQTLYGYGSGAYALWARRLLFEGELTVPKLAWGWFWDTQLPALVRSFLKRPESVPFDLLAAELRGCAAGPWLYLRSRRQSRQRR